METGRHTWLTGDKICLRAMEPEDLAVIHRIENLTDFWRFGTSNVPYSKYAVRQFIAESRNDLFIDGQLRLMIERLGTAETLGCIDLASFSPLHHRAEVGLLILPEHQRCGWAREALDLLCDYSHSFLQLHQLYAYVSVANLPAVGLFRSCGFTCVSTLSDWVADTHKYVDAYLFQKIFS